MTHVFVYGSLRRGQINHHILASRLSGASFVGEGETVDPVYYLLCNSSFPYLLTQGPAPGLGLDLSPSTVSGEVYSVPSDSSFAELDDFEYGYKRSLVPVRVSAATVLECWTYAISAPAEAAEKWEAVRRGQLLHLPDGDWARHNPPKHRSLEEGGEAI